MLIAPVRGRTTPPAAYSEYSVPVTDNIIDLKAFHGLDRSVSEHNLQDGWLRLKSNFGTDDRGALTKVRGVKNVTSASATSIADIQQLYRYYYGAGNKQTLVQAGSAVYTAVSSDFTSIGSGFSTTKIRSFWSFDDICFSVNDYDDMQHYAGSNTMSAAKYTAPGAPVITSGSAGALTGQYQYKLAHVYLHDTGNGGTASVVATVTAKKITVTIPATTAPVLGVNVYRTRNIATAPGTAAQLYYIAYVPGTGSSTYIDNATDTTLVIDESQLAASVKTSAPTTAYGCLAQRRSLIGGGDVYPDRVYFSELNKPYTFYSTSFYRVEDDISGMAEWGGHTYIFQRSEITRIRGTIGLNASLDRRVDPGVGCAAPRTLQFTPKGVFFLANDNVVRVFDGTRSHIISDRADDYIKSALAANLPSACATYADGKYRLWLSGGGASNVQCCVYDTLDNTWYTKRGIAPVAAITAGREADSGEVYIAQGSHVYQDETANAIYLISGVATATNAISAVATTKLYDMGLPSRTKQIRKLEVRYTGGDGSEYIELIADGGDRKAQVFLPTEPGDYGWGTTSSAASTDFVWAESEDDEYGARWGQAATATKKYFIGIPGGVSGKTFQFKVVASGTTAFSLKQLRIYFWHYEA